MYIVSRSKILNGGKFTVKNPRPVSHKLSDMTNLLFFSL